MIIETKYNMGQKVLVGGDIESTISAIKLYGSELWYVVYFWDRGERKVVDVLEEEIRPIKQSKKE